MVIMLHVNGEYGESETLLLECEKRLQREEIETLQTICTCARDYQNDCFEKGEEDITTWDIVQWVIDEAAEAGIKLSYSCIDLELEVNSNY